MKKIDDIKIQMEMIDEFIEKAYDGMVIVDSEGFITKFKYEKVLGIKEKDALGKHVTDIIPTTRLP
jgi:PAS domain S-box-containing protein